MTSSIIRQRLESYKSQTFVQEVQAIKEILQEIVLLSLSRNGFFRKAAFQGGTYLRILYGMFLVQFLSITTYLKIL